MFLKALLLTQPQDRPTAAGALCHAWSADLRSDDACTGYHGAETIRSEYWSTPGRNRENRLATHDGPKKSEGNRISETNTRRVLEGIALSSGVGSQKGGGPSRKTVIDTSVRHHHHQMQRLLSSGLETGPRKSELMHGNFQATDSKGTNVLRRNNKILNTSYPKMSILACSILDTVVD